MTRRRKSIVALLLMAAVGVAACGPVDRGSGHDAIGSDAIAVLQSEVAAAREAAEQRDIPRATTLVGAVEDTVNGLRAQGRLDDLRAAEILAAVGRVQDQLRRLAAGN